MTSYLGGNRAIAQAYKPNIYTPAFLLYSAMFTIAQSTMYNIFVLCLSRQSIYFILSFQKSNNVRAH